MINKHDTVSLRNDQILEGRYIYLHGILPFNIGSPNMDVSISIGRTEKELRFVASFEELVLISSTILWVW